MTFEQKAQQEAIWKNSLQEAGMASGKSRGGNMLGMLGNTRQGSCRGSRQGLGSQVSLPREVRVERMMPENEVTA